MNFKFRNYDRKKHFYGPNNKQKYHRRHLNIPEKYINLLNVNWPHPSVLTNTVLQTIPLNKFNYSEKLDGVHTFLLIFDNKIYNITNTDDFVQINRDKFKDFKYSGDCILETEYYEEVYYIFDVYYLNGVNYSNKFLNERLNSIQEYLDELGPSFRIKKFHEITDLNQLIEYIKNEKSPEGNDIDGIILQRIDKPYFNEGKEPNSYKFKPLHLNTTDFLLKYNRILNDYDLYLLGKYEQFFKNNMKKLPKERDIFRLDDIRRPISKRNYFMYKYEKVLIYFDSPFYPNLGKLELTENWNKENYTLTQTTKINTLIRDMIRNPTDYNDTIMELSLTNDKKWVPFRLRKDKTKPNSYHVGLSNVSVIFDPIKPLSNIYFQKNLSMGEEKLNVIHKINQIFRKYIIETYVGIFRVNSSVLDLCGGRGADEFNLYSNGVSNFFVIDNDTSALRRYFERTFKINKLKYEPLKYTYFNKPNWLNINFLHHKLDKDYEKIKQDLNSRYEFSRGKVDIVIMNFAIHYLCDENEKLRKLCEFVQSVLYQDGIFIITYFDGDEILKKMENNVAKIGPFKIEKVKQENEVIFAKMPLPTIKEGEDIYAEEPLVRRNTIKILEEYFYKYDEFFVYDRCQRYINNNNISGFEEFIPYYSLIKVAIYSKDNKY